MKIETKNYEDMIVGDSSTIDLLKMKNLKVSSLKVGPDVHFNVCIYAYPTWNCQLASAASIGSFLRDATEEEIIRLFIHIRTNYKPSVLLDINEDNLKYINFLSDHFSLCSRYKNTNGSSMAIVIINLKSLYEKYN